MAMVIHKKCGGNILTNITKGMLAYSTFSVQKTGLKMERLSLQQASKKIEPKFYCSSCQTDDLEKEDLQVLCDYCGGRIRSLKTTIYFPALGGFYCTLCQKKHIKTEKDRKGKKTASSLFSNISLVTKRRS